MKLTELRKKDVVRAMPYGKNEITFTGIRYRENEDKDVIGCWVENKEFKPLYIPIFEGDNYQLDLLTEQLGVDSYKESDLAKAKGTMIIAHKYIRKDPERETDFTNISFNPRYGIEQAPVDDLA